MATQRRGPLVAVVTGLVAMVVGMVDPLEGSVLILGGACLVALGAGRARSARTRDAVAALVLIATGCRRVVRAERRRRVGGTTGRSYAWLFLVLPYPWASFSRS